MILKVGNLGACGPRDGFEEAVVLGTDLSHEQMRMTLRSIEPFQNR